MTNLGDPITNGWTLDWDFAGNQRVTQGWSGTFSQTGQHVTVQNPSWSPDARHERVGEPRLQRGLLRHQRHPGVVLAERHGVHRRHDQPADHAADHAAHHTADDAAHHATDHPADHATDRASRRAPRSTTRTPGSRATANPEWQAKANAEPGGNRVSNNPTAVWLDRIAAIAGTTGSSSNGSMGLRDHLDAALAQGAGYIQFVIYNLPGRDCSALASNGELGVNDLPRYKAEYIDPIAAIQADPKYRSLRIINIIEIDSLPNLVTNTNVADLRHDEGQRRLRAGRRVRAEQAGRDRQRLQLRRRRAPRLDRLGHQLRPDRATSCSRPPAPPATCATCTASSPTRPTTRR